MGGSWVQLPPPSPWRGTVPVQKDPSLCFTPFPFFLTQFLCFLLTTLIAFHCHLSNSTLEDVKQAEEQQSFCLLGASVTFDLTMLAPFQYQASVNIGIPLFKVHRIDTKSVLHINLFLLLLCLHISFCYFLYLICTDWVRYRCIGGLQKQNKIKQSSWDLKRYNT